MDLNDLQQKLHDLQEAYDHSWAYIEQLKSRIHRLEDHAIWSYSSEHISKMRLADLLGINTASVDNYVKDFVECLNKN